MPSPLDRAAYRRANWVGGVAQSHDEAAELEVEFWMHATPAERILGVTQLVEEMRTLGNPHESPARLQRTVGGVRPRRG